MLHDWRFTDHIRRFTYMHLTQQLFNPEEAFVRLGQTRQLGCLVIVSPAQSIHLFVENGFVVSALAGEVQGEQVLKGALTLANSSYVWIPDSRPTQKIMSVNISAFALKNAIARDIHIAATGKVPLPVLTETPPLSPKKKHLKTHYLTAEDRPGEKLILINPTVVLGRDESCDIVLNHVQVSRRHCLIQLIPRGISFRDLASTNGVMVNGFPAQDGFLSPGDMLQLGTYALKLHRDA